MRQFIPMRAILLFYCCIAGTKQYFTQYNNTYGATPYGTASYGAQQTWPSQQQYAGYGSAQSNQYPAGYGSTTGYSGYPTSQQQQQQQIGWRVGNNVAGSAQQPYSNPSSPYGYGTQQQQQNPAGTDVYGNFHITGYGRLQPGASGYGSGVDIYGRQQPPGYGSPQQQQQYSNPYSSQTQQQQHEREGSLLQDHPQRQFGNDRIVYPHRFDDQNNRDQSSGSYWYNNADSTKIGNKVAMVVLLMLLSVIRVH